MKKSLFMCLALLMAATAARAGDFDALKARLAADGVPRAQLDDVFSNPRVAFTPDAMGKKLLEMYTRKFGSAVVLEMQKRLADLGYFFGKADGRPDTVLRTGIRTFQKDHGLPEDGRLSMDLLTLARQERKKAGPETSARLKELADKGPPDIYESILQPERLAEAREFLDANRKVLEEVRARYGVPPELAVGLLTLETRVGRFLGENTAFNNLASMAASTSSAKVMSVFDGETVTPGQAAWLDKQAAGKADWAYKELKALFKYGRDNHLEIAALPGSIYGAIGISQFMPTSILVFGMDGDGDGRIDIFTVPDAVHSMANYLRKHGFSGNLDDEATMREALFRYNHSQTYVNTIMALFHYLKGGPARP
ncbi:MAG: lytic murein transglycosylase [Thermodesulfobacteriota bacterium]